MIYSVIFLTSLAAGVIQTVTGFGAAVIMMLVAPGFLGMLKAPALTSVMVIGLSVGLYIKLHKKVDYRTVLIQAAIYVSVSMLTIAISEGFDMEILALAFGVFLIALSVYYLFFSKAVAVRPGPVSALACGIGSGFFGGLFSVGGPLSAIYFLAVSKDKESYIANLQFLFIITNTVNTLVRIRYGIFTAELIPLAIVGIIGINLGKIAGLKIVDRIDIELMKRIIYIFIGISGAINIMDHI